MYYVYLIEKESDKLYIGYTNDLHRRMKEHKTKLEDLIYYEAYKAREDATKSAWGQLQLKKRIIKSRI